MSIVASTNERRKNRQDYEWRFTISFWTLLIAAIFYGHDVSILKNELARGAIALAALALYLFLWLIGVHKSHQADRVFGKSYQEAAIKILESEGVKTTPESIDPLKAWGAWFQACITALLLLIFTFSGFA